MRFTPTLSEFLGEHCGSFQTIWQVDCVTNLFKIQAEKAE